MVFSSGVCMSILRGSISVLEKYMVIIPSDFMRLTVALTEYASSFSSVLIISNIWLSIRVVPVKIFVAESFVGISDF